MARRRTPARVPPLSGGEAAMAGAEHATARRTAASSVSTAAAARPPSPFPRRSRRLALSGGGSGALAPRRLDNDDELPLLPSSLFRPPHSTWVPSGSPRPVSTGGRPFPPRPGHPRRRPQPERRHGHGGPERVRRELLPPPARLLLQRGRRSSAVAPVSGARPRLASPPHASPLCGSRRHPHGRGGCRPRRRPEAATAAWRGGDERTRLAATNARRASGVEAQRTRGEGAADAGQACRAEAPLLSSASRGGALRPQSWPARRSARSA